MAGRPVARSRCAILVAALVVSACGGTGRGPLGRGLLDGGQRGGARTTAVVTRVVDGDTIEVSHRGETLDVRLIGVDAPESVHPTEPVECLGTAASNFTRRELEGATVELEFDVERRDRYGRTLAYVWAEGGLFNERLVAAGFAVVSTFPPNVRYVDRLVAAQRSARAAGRGLWGACPR